jgi:hypothetical protein
MTRGPDNVRKHVNNNDALLRARMWLGAQGDRDPHTLLGGNAAYRRPLGREVITCRKVVSGGGLVGAYCSRLYPTEGMVAHGEQTDARVRRHGKQDPL